MSDQIDILSGLLKTAGIRHGALTSNIANVDTPGYKAKDVEFGRDLDSELTLRATSHGHRQAGGPDRPADVRVIESKPWVDGNTVELDMEVAKMTENAMLFQAGVTMLQMKIKMMKSALRTR